MSTTQCALAGCDKPVKRGRTYCGRSHAALAREEKRRQKATKKPADFKLVRHGAVTGELVNKLQDKFGDGANDVIREVTVMLQEANSVKLPLPTSTVTYADLSLSFDGKKDLRPGNRLSYDIIKSMKRNGMVIFCTGMRQAQITKQFTRGRAIPQSPDQELADVAQASLLRVLPRMASDFVQSSIDYGTSFQEEEWEWKSLYELGLGKDRNARAMFLVPKVPKTINPTSIDHIRRTASGDFNGFAQRKKSGLGTIEVKAEPALVVPYNNHFGNLWGVPMLENLYVLWLWYEIIMRAMHRYMERMAMPVTVGKAPSQATVEVEGQDDYVNALDVVLSVAGNVAKSNAVAIPSDRDENGNLLWEVGYMTAPERAQPYVDVLGFLGQEMLRAVLSADRSLTQSSGGVGSYGIGEVHERASAWSAEMILINYLFYLNKYFMPGFSLYNRGRNGPPIWLDIQTLDVQGQQTLLSLINVAANSKSADDFFNMIDWRSLSEKSNIPILSEEDAKKRKEELLKESLDNQRKQQEMMQKFKVDGKLQPKQGKAQPESNADNKDDGVKQEDLTEAILARMDRGDVIPVVMSQSDLGRALASPDFKESNVSRDEGGRFAPKDSGGSKKKELDPEQQERLDELKDKIDAMDDGPIKDAALKALATAESLLSQGAMFDTPEEAVSELNEIMRDMGVDGLQPISSFGVAGEGELGENTAGKYDPNTNSFVIAPWLNEEFESGNPIATSIIAHELLHSNQEVHRSPGDGEKYADWNGEQMKDVIVYGGDSELKNFLAMTEGQNDLMEGAVMSKVYGEPVTPLSMSILSKALYDDPGVTDGYKIGRDSWLMLANNKSDDAAEQYDFIREAHNTGFDMRSQNDIVSGIVDYDSDFYEPRYGYQDLYESTFGEDFSLSATGPLNDAYVNFYQAAIDFNPKPEPKKETRS